MRRFSFLILVLILFSPQLPSTAQTDNLAARETMRIGRGTIRHVEWHPDGDLILVDTASGAWLYNEDLNDVAHLPNIRLARFSPDGRYISGVNPADELLIYDARTRDRLHTFAQHDHHIRELHWQGNRLATYDGYQLVLWEDLEVTAVIDWRFLELLTWNPSGTLLVAKQLNGKLLVVTPEGESWTFDAPGQDTQSLQWQDDFTILHTYRSPSVGAVGHFISAQTGKVIDQVFGSYVNLSYTAWDDWLAVASSDELIAFHKVHGVAWRDPMNHVSASIVRWSPNGRYLAYAKFVYSGFEPDGPLVRVLNLSGKVIFEGHDLGSRYLEHLLWYPDGNQLLTIDSEQRIHLWNIASKENTALRLSHGMITNHFAFSPSGKMVAFADTLNGFSVWDENGLEYQTTAHTSPIELIEWQPKGDLLATASMSEGMEEGQIDSRVLLWDGPSSNMIDILTLEAPPRDLEWRPDGKVLGIAAYPDISFWNGNLITLSSEELNLGTYGQYRALNWSPDSQYVSFVHHPGTVIIENLWSYGNWQNTIGRAEIISGHTNTDSILGWGNGEWRHLIWRQTTINNPGQYIFAGPIIQTLFPTESDLIQLDPATEPLEELTHYRQMAWSPDASLIIGESDSNIFRVWDVESRAYLYWTEGYAFAFSPDSRYLAVLTDTHVNILDARTGDILLAIDDARFPQDEYTLHWSDDGTHLAVGGEGVVSVWEVGTLHPHND
ncbi:MAG: WD40 repeat domain-containing protein [Chloroflexi bacterium]|nr:WD40 repeat domain-containing protein [Chloroflexota bacterium]